MGRDVVRVLSVCAVLGEGALDRNGRGRAGSVQVYDVRHTLGEASLAVVLARPGVTL